MDRSLASSADERDKIYRVWLLIRRQVNKWRTASNCKASDGVNKRAEFPDTVRGTVLKS